MSQPSLLERMQCPRCEVHGPWEITITKTVCIYRNGVMFEITPDVLAWDRQSYCDCRSCGYSARVEDFLPLVLLEESR